jgi:quercetin dioxygenase-like cupin family protein
LKSAYRNTALVVLAAAAALVAQNPGIQRTIIQRKDLSMPGREAVVARVEVAPGTYAGRHTHNGEEIGYLIEGEGEVLIEGQPAIHLKPGDSFIVPAGAKHDAHNTGSAPMKMVSVYLIEKGKPLATPAP